MSRIGKLPIAIPKGVDVDIKDGEVLVKGPKGTLSVPSHPKVSVAIEDGKVMLTQVDDSRAAREQHGLRRTLLSNAITGVEKGFEKGLELVGVGYKVDVQGQTVVLNVGYSKAMEFPLPKGIEARTEGAKLFISGFDKQAVGEVAAQIRKIRPPEPYKGKGIKYIGEHIRRKAGKSAAK